MITYVMCKGLHVCAYVHVVCTCVCVCTCVHSIPLSLLYTAVRTIVAIDHMIEIVKLPSPLTLLPSHALKTQSGNGA